MNHVDKKTRNAERLCDALYTFLAIAENRNSAATLERAIAMLQAERRHSDADPNHQAILKAGETFLREALVRSWTRKPPGRHSRSTASGSPDHTTTPPESS
jgi:hypothetical protein